MGKIQLVIFDIAGTTVTDHGEVAGAFMDAFKKHGIRVQVEDVNKVMGFRKKDAIKSLLEQIGHNEDNSAELIEKIHDAFTQNMISAYETQSDLQPLPYAEQTFQLLNNAGVKVALNTGFTKTITDTIMRRLGWNTNPMIHYIISSDEVAQGRPHPFMIRKIMEVLGVDDAKRVAKVGDTEVDVQEGRNAGCGMVISVTTGSYNRKQLESYDPDFIIDSLEQLPALIK